MFAELTPSSGVNGKPERTVVIPFTCQFPIAAFSKLFLISNRLPCPTGSA